VIGSVEFSELVEGGGVEPAFSMKISSVFGLADDTKVTEGVGEASVLFSDGLRDEGTVEIVTLTTLGF